MPLTPYERNAVRDLHKRGLSPMQIVRTLNVPHSAVKAVLRRGPPEKRGKESFTIELSSQKMERLRSSAARRGVSVESLAECFVTYVLDRVHIDTATRDFNFKFNARNDGRGESLGYETENVRASA